MAGKVLVKFLDEDCNMWECWMPFRQLKLLVDKKPLIEGNRGKSVYEIDEFRFDVESEEFTFWLKKWEPAKEVPYVDDPDDV